MMNTLDGSQAHQDSTKRVCQKIPFNTQNEALEYIKHIKIARKFRSKKNKSQKGNRNVHYYECLKCGKYHLTSQKTGSKYAKAKRKLAR